VVIKMFKVEVRTPTESNVFSRWFDTLVEAESYVLGFNSSANDGRVAMVVPFH